jgi:hypothetical protein
MNAQAEDKPLKKPTVFADLYPGRFIKAEELKGKKVTLTITDVDVERLVGDDGAKKVKAIISFKESEKKLVACKTTGTQIMAMFTKDLANWIGKRVTLFEDVWNDEPCLRIFGSPDIEADMEVTIALPRRRPFKKMLHKMDAAKRLEVAP